MSSRSSRQGRAVRSRDYAAHLMARESRCPATGDGELDRHCERQRSNPDEAAVGDPQSGSRRFARDDGDRSEFGSGGTRSSAASRKLSGRERKCERGYYHCRLRHGRRDAERRDLRRRALAFSSKSAANKLPDNLGNAGCSRDLSARRVPPRTSLDRRRRRGLQSRGTTITSAATRSSMAPYYSVIAHRIFAPSFTPREQPRAGRSTMTRWSHGILAPRRCTKCAAPSARIRPSRDIPRPIRFRPFLTNQRSPRRGQRMTRVGSHPASPAPRRRRGRTG